MARWASAGSYVCQLKPEGVPEADRRLRRLPDETAVGDQRALADPDEQLVAGVIFPPIACREGEVFADVVVLRLQGGLHHRSEVDDRIRGGEVDVDRAGRQIDRVGL